MPGAIDPFCQFARNSRVLVASADIAIGKVISRVIFDLTKLHSPRLTIATN